MPPAAQPRHSLRSPHPFGGICRPLRGNAPSRRRTYRHAIPRSLCNIGISSHIPQMSYPKSSQYPYRLFLYFCRIVFGRIKGVSLSAGRLAKTRAPFLKHNRCLLEPCLTLSRPRNTSWRKRHRLFFVYVVRSFIFTFYYSSHQFKVSPSERETVFVKSCKPFL